MSLNRTKWWLTAWVFVFLMGAPVSAQGVRDMAVFAEPNLSTYGGGPRPNEGLFFSFDWLWWGITPPNVAKIGDRTIEPTTVYTGVDESFEERNSVDTGYLTSQFTEGQRIELGAMMEHHGWLFSGFRLTPQEQTLLTRQAHVLFKDEISKPIGFLEGYVDTAQVWRLPNGRLPRLPTIFNYLKAENVTEPWSVELMYVYRTHPTHRGSQIEFFLGARYMEINDRFRVWGLDAPPIPPDPEAGTPTAPGPGVPTTGGDDNTGGGGSEIIGRPNGVPLAPVTQTPINILADSFWHTYAENHIVGPQVGARIFHTWGRWTLNTEGRFFAGFNRQNFRQSGMLGSKLFPPPIIPGLPQVTTPTWLSHDATLDEFSPGAELKIEAVLQLTKNMSLKAGWTGLYLGHIARAADVIDYQMPTMGLNLGDSTKQSIWLNGVNLGLSINR